MDWQLLVGTLSGFLIAFFAEPIKTYFTSRHQKAALREALYREIASNHLMLLGIRNRSGSTASCHTRTVEVGYIERHLRFECYQNVLKETPRDLYQLEEAPAIHLIYGELQDFTAQLGMAGNPGKGVLRMVTADMIVSSIERIGEIMTTGGIKLKVIKKVSKEIADDLKKYERLYASRYLTRNYLTQLVAKVPPHNHANVEHYVNIMLDQLLDEVVDKGKDPEKALAKLKVPQLPLDPKVEQGVN